MLNPERLDELKEMLKSGAKDACVCLDSVWLVGCEHYYEPNCRLQDRRECPLLDVGDRELLRKTDEVVRDTSEADEAVFGEDICSK